MGITQPTLVIHVKGDRAANIVHGRLLAALISDAEFVEVSGTDHFWWVQPNFRNTSATP